MVKQTMLLLLLAAVGLSMADHHHDCNATTKALPRDNLDKIFGDWVLVWSASDQPSGSNYLENLTSSHVELHLNADKSGIEYVERNSFSDAPCSTYRITLRHGAQRQAEQDGAQKQAEQDGAQRQAEQDGAQKQAEQDGAQRQAEQDGAQKQAEQDGAQKQAEQDGAQKQAEQDGAQKQAEQDGAQKQAEQDGAQRQAEQDGAQKQAEQDGAQKQAEQDGAQKQAEQDGAQRHAEHDHHRLQVISSTFERAGEVKIVEDATRGKVSFFHSGEDSLSMLYDGVEGKFVLIYKKEGLHRDVAAHKESHEDHQKLSHCLGIDHSAPFIYDGEADFCHKKSAAEEVVVVEAAAAAAAEE
ncbi:uncharacterized protein V6R79_005678 [Siganus canaliculatus]